MTLGEHLDELRKRIFLAAIVPILVAVVLLFFGGQILTFLLKPLHQALSANELPSNIVAPSALTVIMLYMKIALIGGFVFGVPWVLWQMWLFVAPGLFPHERKFVTRLMPFSLIMACLGVLFMYYIMLPVTLWFLVGFTTGFPLDNNVAGTWFASPGHAESVKEYPEVLVFPLSTEDPPDPKPGQAWINVSQNRMKVFMGVVDDEPQYRTLPLSKPSLIQPLFHVDQYISLVLMFALGFAIAFQLPLVMLGAAASRLVTYAFMRKHWRGAAMGCTIIGALLTPADPGSMLALAVPLYLLYEFGLVLVRILVKPRPANDDDDDQNGDSDDQSNLQTVPDA